MKVLIIFIPLHLKKSENYLKNASKCLRSEEHNNLRRQRHLLIAINSAFYFPEYSKGH